MLQALKLLSQYKINDRVVVEGDPNGNYEGWVIAVHSRLTKPSPVREGTQLTKPGVTVLVDRWEGVAYDGQDGASEPFEILAWDNEILTRPDAVVVINGVSHLPVLAIYDRETETYNGLVPLPAVPMPGFYILFRRGVEIYTLRWVSEEDEGFNASRAQQGLSQVNIKGFWKGDRLRIVAGRSNGATDCWQLHEEKV
tara:strand:- start:126 stop:716 length:591 start_codon:yes stop_codon:yes gene_type:complete